MAKETIVQTILDNGLRIKLKQQPHQRTVNLGLFIQHGSQNEDVDSNGIAHYIEHVVFNAHHMPADVRELLNMLMDAGLSYEAYTSKEYTRFIVTCRPQQVDQALIMLSKIISCGQVTPESIDHERHIILHEHAMTFSSSNVLKELLDNTIWGERSLGLFVIGRKENIARFDRHEIEDRLRRYYVAERTTLVALGPIDAETFVDRVERSFDTWQSMPYNFPDPQVITEPRVAALPAANARVDLLLAYPGVPYASADRFAMELLADVLGGGLKSRLFVELREKQKLAYLVHAYPVSYGYGGYIAVKVNCEAADLLKAYTVIQQQIERLRTEGVDGVELARVKAARSTALLGVLENSGQHLHLLGRRALLNDDFFVDLETRRIEAVQDDDLLRMAREIFIPGNVAVVGLGPKEEQLLQLV